MTSMAEQWNHPNCFKKKKKKKPSFLYVSSVQITDDHGSLSITILDK